MPTTILRTRDGKLDPSDVPALEALGQRLRDGAPKVLLYLHGGLVDQDSAEQAAKRLAGPEGFAAHDDWEQIYIVWRTGPFETLRTNWKDVFENDRLYKALFKRLMSFVSSKVNVVERAGRSLGAEKELSPAEIERRLASGDDQPFADVDEIYIRETGTRSSILVDDRDARGELARELELDDDFTRALEDIEAALAEGHPTAARKSQTGDPTSGAKSLERLDRKVVGDLQAPAAAGGTPRGLIGFGMWAELIGHAVDIGITVLKRYRKQRDHGLHATVAEEIVRRLYGDLIGSIVWDMMKQDAVAHFAKNAAGESLLKLLETNPQTQLVVVGHSAGAIWATQFLLASERRGGAIAMDLVLLAPAVRIRSFATALNAAAGRIKNFRLFAMRDALERRDAVLGRGFGFLYPSSLLYLVSGLFEEDDSEAAVDVPLLGMQRFLQVDTSWLGAEEAAAVKTVLAFLAARPNREVFALSSIGAGLNSAADSHGGFDNDPQTLASVATFLA